MRRMISALGVLAVLAGCGVSDEGDPMTGPEDIPRTPASDGAVAPPEDVPSPAETDADVGGEDDGAGEVDAGPPPECTDATDWICNDGSGCTEDACVAGACVNAPIAGCCTTDAECDDGVPCTVDTCNPIQQVCMHPFEDNFCCLGPADCEDGDPCTQDVCAAHRCVHPRAADCACGSDFDCDDGNPCTSEVCSEGACVYVGAEGPQCCADQGACDDGDALTVDQCQLGMCWHHALPCASDEDCGGPSPCATGACVDGACVYPDEGCCLWDQGCDDGHLLTTDHCVGGTCVHALGAPEPCEGGADCAGLGPCAGGSCAAAAGLCSYAPLDGEGCCAGEADCVASSACVVPSCVAFSCQEVAAAGDAVWWADDFDAGDLTGWTADNDGTEAGWQVSSAQATSAPWSLYYGRLPQQDYDVGHTAGSVTSPMITLPATGVAGLRVGFARHAMIEAISSTDQLWLEVVNGSGEVAVVWTKNDDGGPGLGWKVEDLDLTGAVTGAFQLRFQFDTVDAINNDGEGVYVDDVVVTVPCD